MTTPSAKADGFCVHARTIVPRYGRKAQSEPQNITGSVDISVNRKPTVRAIKKGEVSVTIRKTGRAAFAKCCSLALRHKRKVRR